MTVTWLIDEYLLEGTLSASLPQIIAECGCNLIRTKYVPFSHTSNILSGFSGDKIIVYGTHGFIRQVQNTAFYIDPGAFCNEANLNCMTYMTKFPKELFLNEEGYFLPFHMVDKNKTDYFIRPDSGIKKFAGKAIREERDLPRISDDPNGLQRDTICLIAPLKEIQAEYRLFVVDRKVVAGSQYRRDNKLDIRRDISMEAATLADKVIAHDWQPDDLYVVDIADTPTGSKIIEFNSFSCSGMYACDQHAIVRAVSEYIENRK